MATSHPLATHHLAANQPAAITQTAVFAQNGGLVVIPTDTVYGIGCDALQNDAILQLYRVKQRPLHKAIPVLLADISDLASVVSHVPLVARPFIERYWPGPLTIILPKKAGLPPALSASDTLAVRIPAHETARAVIRAVGGAMAVTSANLSNAPAAQTAVTALATFCGLVTAVLDDGPTPGPLASTIIDCTQQLPTILRQGVLALDVKNSAPPNG